MSESAELYPKGVALVIGGSGGVGQAISKALSDNNVPVCLTYNRNRDGAQTVVADCGGAARHISCAQVDVQNIDTLRRCVDQALKKYGRLHSVFIATGYDIPQSSISEVTPELWQRVMRSDAEGTFNVIHATLPHLRAGGGRQLHSHQFGWVTKVPTTGHSVRRTEGGCGRID